jgi:hypothetical protein
MRGFTITVRKFPLFKYILHTCHIALVLWRHCAAQSTSFFFTAHWVAWVSFILRQRNLKLQNLNFVAILSVLFSEQYINVRKFTTIWRRELLASLQEFFWIIINYLFIVLIISFDCEIYKWLTIVYIINSNIWPRELVKVRYHQSSKFCFR